MNRLELVAYALFAFVAWGHGFLTGVPYGAWRGDGEEASVTLSCPETRGTIATEETTPRAWEDREDAHSVAVYACPECPEYHRFLWGPPAPVYVGDADPAEVPLLPGRNEDPELHASDLPGADGWTPDDGAGYIPTEERGSDP